MRPTDRLHHHLTFHPFLSGVLTAALLALLVVPPVMLTSAANPEHYNPSLRRIHDEAVESTTPTTWGHAIPQETLVCFNESPRHPYLIATANNGTADPWVRVTAMPTYYLVSYSDHAGFPDISLRLPLAQCIYREPGGVTP